MQIELKSNEIVDALVKSRSSGILSKRLEQSLSNLNKPFTYDLSNIDKGVLISLQLNQKILVINVDKDRLYSETAFVFLLWLIFASLYY